MTGPLSEAAVRSLFIGRARRDEAGAPGRAAPETLPTGGPLCRQRSRPRRDRHRPPRDVRRPRREARRRRAGARVGTPTARRCARRRARARSTSTPRRSPTPSRAPSSSSSPCRSARSSQTTRDVLAAALAGRHGDRRRLDEARARAGIDDERFVPGHPIAGGATGGPTRASADLFDAATWLLTPLPTTERRAPRARRAVRDGARRARRSARRGGRTTGCSR